MSDNEKMLRMTDDVYPTKIKKNTMILQKKNNRVNRREVLKSLKEMCIGLRGDDTRICTYIEHEKKCTVIQESVPEQYVIRFVKTVQRYLRDRVDRLMIIDEPSTTVHCCYKGLYDFFNSLGLPDESLQTEIGLMIPSTELIPARIELETVWSLVQLLIVETRIGQRGATGESNQEERNK